MQKRDLSFWDYWWQENWVAAAIAVLSFLMSWPPPVNRVDNVLQIILLAVFTLSALYIIRKTWVYDRECYKRIRSGVE